MGGGIQDVMGEGKGQPAAHPITATAGKHLQVRCLVSKHVTRLGYLNTWRIKCLKSVTKKCLTLCLDLKHFFF